MARRLQKVRNTYDIHCACTNEKIQEPPDSWETTNKNSTTTNIKQEPGNTSATSCGSCWSAPIFFIRTNSPNQAAKDCAEYVSHSSRTRTQKPAYRSNFFFFTHFSEGVYYRNLQTAAKCPVFLHTWQELFLLVHSCDGCPRLPHTLHVGTATLLGFVGPRSGLLHKDKSKFLYIYNSPANYQLQITISSNDSVDSLLISVTHYSITQVEFQLNLRDKRKTFKDHLSIFFLKRHINELFAKTGEYDKITSSERSNELDHL